MMPKKSVNPSRESESLLEYSQRMKAIDRKRLLTLDPEIAQNEVNAILIGDSTPIPGNMIWPGDLADDAEDPQWMNPS